MKYLESDKVNTTVICTKQAMQLFGWTPSGPPFTVAMEPGLLREQGRGPGERFHVQSAAKIFAISNYS